jgi:glyoxylase-like metal-dependent hydrolase (beta-lactamase superfamily II)/rhodanese-related sulfurtransferase
MIFRQVIQDDLGCASYLVGDDHAKVAAVVDPRLDIDIYLELAELAGVRITDVIETHTHADHVSGHGRLAEATGAAIHVNPEAEAAYANEPMPDGAEIVLGDVVIRAVHLPGHRPEHTVLEVIDTARGNEPWALLSGDSLLVGDVARPDLAVAEEDGAVLMYDGLDSLLGRLAPQTELWPGHIGGSACGSAGIDMKTSSTLGFERAHNPLLNLTKDEFVSSILGDLGDQPANFEAIVAINRGPLAAAESSPRTVGASDAQALIADGAIPVDVRDAADFDAAHISGSVSIPTTRSGFATSLARILGPADQILLLGDDEAHARRAAGLAEGVGIDRVGAVLDGGFEAWLAAGFDTEATETLTPEELGERVDGSGLQVIDVREEETWRAGSIPGSVNSPYYELGEVPEGIDPQRPVAVVCSAGRRSGIGASLLQRAGAEDVIHVVGGGVADALDASAKVEAR